MTVFVALDTSIFMEFKRPDQIPWKTLTKSDEVVLLVTPQVQTEIDNHKRSESRRKRRRAEATIRWFREAKQCASIADGITLRFLIVEPRCFDEYELDHTVPDDRVLASVLSFRREQAEHEVWVATADFGMELKAEHRQIRVVAVPDELRLPQDEDPEVLQLRKERDDLQRRERSAPRLQVRLGNDQDHVDVDVTPVSAVSDVGIEEILTAERAALTAVDGLVISRAESGQEVEAEAWHIDPQAIEKHLLDLRAHLRAQSLREQARSRTFELSFVLQNEGTAPATNIDVYFHLPDWVQLRSEAEFPAVPERPEFHSGAVAMLMALNRRLDEANRFPIGIQLPKLDGFFDEERRWRLIKLRHGGEDEVNLFVQLDPAHELAGFSIGFEVRADEIPDPVVGRLHINLRSTATA